MKEQLYTIPLNDAINENDECLFCYLEKKLEEDSLDFILGNSSSYMEPDIRNQTDLTGFCRTHFKKMYDYSNALGNAWILKTHYMRMIKEFEKEKKAFSPGKATVKLFPKRNASTNNLVQWIQEKEASCYFCNHYRETYKRYMDTFFYLYKQDDAFRQKVLNGKGFCLPHFKDMMEHADTLPTKEQEGFYAQILPVMSSNLERILEDVSWMVEKFDYRNQDADWKNSRDSIQRGMQKLKGGYPAAGVYKMNK